MLVLGVYLLMIVLPLNKVCCVVEIVPENFALMDIYGGG